MKNKRTLLAITLFAFSSTLSAQFAADITFGYDTSVLDPGGAYETVGDTWGRIYDSAGTTALAENDSVAAIGYFTSEPTNWSANIGIFDDFVFLAQGNVENFGTPFPGDFNTTAPGVDVTAANGLTAYFAVFKGVTDTANYASATEFALLSSSNWIAIGGAESPSTPTELAYTIGRTAIGAGVYVGTEVDDTRFDDGEGFNYNTAVVVPEPSAFALLFSLSVLFFAARRR